MDHYTFMKKVDTYTREEIDKIADSLVEGLPIQIEGGDYQLKCTEEEENHLNCVF